MDQTFTHNNDVDTDVDVDTDLDADADDHRDFVAPSPPKCARFILNYHASTAPEKVRAESYTFVSWWGFLAKVPFQNTLENQHGTQHHEGVW